MISIGRVANDVIYDLAERRKARANASVPELARELAGTLDQRNKARIAKEREAQRVAWEENPTRYRNQIIAAVKKLRKIEGPTAVMVFLDDIIVGKVGGE